MFIRTTLGIMEMPSGLKKIGLGLSERANKGRRSQALMGFRRMLRGALITSVLVLQAFGHPHLQFTGGRKRNLFSTTNQSASKINKIRC